MEERLAGTIDVSVVIPVFNARPFLETTFRSLITNRTKISFEVLCTDDGSSDGSLEFCRCFADTNPEWRVFANEKKGVSSARNTGLKHARGKYVLFLDSDDWLSDEALLPLFSFLEAHPETDLATFPLYEVQDKSKGKSLTRKYKLQYGETGIYDIHEYPQLNQTTINYMFRRNRPLFFDESMILAEDQAFSNALVLEKGKIGYVKEVQYCYRRGIQSASGIQADNSNDWEIYYGYFEHLKESNTVNGATLPYVQYALLNFYNNLRSQQKLFPHHFSQEGDYQAAKERILAIFDTIEDRCVLDYRLFNSLDRYLFFKITGRDMSLSESAENDGSFAVCAGGISFCELDMIEFYIQYIGISEGSVRIVVNCMSPLFDFIADPVFEMKCGDNVLALTAKRSMRSDDKFGETRIPVVWFEAVVPAGSAVCTFRLTANGRQVPVSVWTSPITPQNAYRDGLLVSVNKDGLSIRKKSRLSHLLSIVLNRAFHSPKNALIRLLGAVLLAGKPVWLYQDDPARDIAWRLFVKDSERRDGIKRYYTSTAAPSAESSDSAAYAGRILSFGSNRHIFAAVRTRLLISSTVNTEPRKWFLRVFRDLLLTKRILLPQFPMKFRMPAIYARDMLGFDAVVARSEEDCENWLSLGYRRDDILYGADVPEVKTRQVEEEIDAAENPQKILLAFSWRAYLSRIRSGEIVARDAEFLRSDYAKFLNELAVSQQVRDFLSQNRISLDIILHPVMDVYRRHFADSDFIQFLHEDSINMASYRILISDFTSYEYEARALGLPVIIAIPDMAQIKGGMHHFNRFMDDSLSVCTTVQELTAAIKSVLADRKTGVVADPGILSEENISTAIHRYAAE